MLPEPASTVEVVTAEEERPEADAEAAAASAPKRLATRRVKASRWISPSSPALVYLGIVVVLAGFGVLAFTWSRVAGESIVALQLPYVASGGFGGLGLVVVGVLTIHLAARRRDAWQRDRRLVELANTLEAHRPPAAQASDEAENS